MLQILVNKTALILSPDTKIRLEMNTSYFDSESIKGDVVWHFDVPAAGNEETFEYANYIIVRNKKRAYDCIIKLHNMPIGRGKLIVSTATSKTFRVTVSLNSFGVDFEGVSLKEAPYQPERIGGNPHTEAAVIQHATDVNAETLDRDYRFPMVYAPEFYGSMVTTDDIAGEHPEFNKDYIGYLNLWEEGAFVPNKITEVVSNKQSLVPFPMMIPVIEKTLSLKDYSIAGALNTEEYLKDILLFNNVSLDNYISNFFLSATSDRNQESFGNIYKIAPLELVLQDDDNTYVNYTYQVREDGTYNVLASLLITGYTTTYRRSGLIYRSTEGVMAIFKNDDFIAEVAYSYPRQFYVPPTVNISRHFTFATGDLITVRVKATANTVGVIKLDESVFQVFKVIEENINLNTHKNQLNLTKHIPDIKVTTLLNSVRNAFFMAVFFDDENKVIETELLKDVLNNPYTVDVSDHIIRNSHELIPEETKSIQLKWNHTEELNDIDPANLINTVVYFNDLIAQYQKSYALLSGSNAVYVYDKPDDADNPEWSYYRQNFADYGTSEADLKPSIDICPMPTREINIPTQTTGGISSPSSRYNPDTDAATYNGKIFPYTSKKGVSDKVPESDSDVGVQLLHWYGVHDIPVGLSLNKREAGEVLGPLSIDFNGSNGIVTNLGTEWLSFISSSEEFRVLLTDIDIWKLLEIQSLFLPKKKSNHPRWVLADNVKALPKQVTAEIEIRGIITAFEMKLVKPGNQ